MIFKQGKNVNSLCVRRYAFGVKRSTPNSQRTTPNAKRSTLNAQRLTKISIFLVLFIWCAGIFSEFIIPLKSGLAVIIPFLNIAYSNVCHQIPEKEISSGILHSLVCSRCSGIYIGALLSSILIIFRKSIHLSPYLNILLFFTVVPILTDVVLYNIGVYHYSKNVAFLTGLLSGSAGFLYILDAFLKFIYEYKRKKV